MTDKPLILAARARALVERGEDCYDALDEAEQLRMQESAKAMLLAMRRPNDAMMRAGATALHHHGRLTSNIDAMLVWERMIDAAVSE